MTRLVAAELLKLRSTRTGIALIGSVVVLTALISILASVATSDFRVDLRDYLGIAGFAALFALVLGILAVTTEFRHGTITPALVAVPRRDRLVAAKLAAHLLAGMVLGLSAIAVCAALVLLILDARGVDTDLGGGDLARIVIGQTAGAGLWAALGVGLGAVVRNQVGAIVGALAWVFAIENLLTIIPGIGDTVRKYGLNGVSSALGNLQTANTGDLLGQVPGGLMLAAYAAVFVVAGALVLRRVDVTS
jgi:ABC-2 type transport system permease protein